mmetsp:Transcript_6231/g.10589  ORF Transcript_6231/g.10589 Transcript_6231/m.10589 type:complete len:86 (-) Transcript_6231:155-412(-)
MRIRKQGSAVDVTKGEQQRDYQTFGNAKPQNSDSPDTKIYKDMSELNEIEMLVRSKQNMVENNLQTPQVNLDISDKQNGKPGPDG